MLTTSIILRRASARLPTITSFRFYTQKDAFAEKEKAAEDMYIRQHEKEKLAKLKEQLAKLEQEKAELEQSINNKNKK